MPINFERSALTEQLIATLRGVNDEVSYAALANTARATVMQVKNSLPSARRILAGDHIYFGIITGEGLKRLYGVDLAKKSDSNKRKVFRACKRSEKELEYIPDFEKLALKDQTTITTNRTLFAMMRQRVDAPMPVPDIARVDLGMAAAVVNMVKK